MNINTQQWTLYIAYARLEKITHCCLWSVNEFAVHEKSVNFVPFCSDIFWYEYSQNKMSYREYFKPTYRWHITHFTVARIFCQSSDVGFIHSTAYQCPICNLSTIFVRKLKPWTSQQPNELQCSWKYSTHKKHSVKTSTVLYASEHQEKITLIPLNCYVWFVLCSPQLTCGGV